MGEIAWALMELQGFINIHSRKKAGEYVLCEWVSVLFQKKNVQ